MAVTTKKQTPLASTDIRAEESKWTIKFYETNIDKLALVGTPPSEQETIVTFERESDRAIIETTDPTVFTKLKKRLTSEENDDWRLEGVSRPSEAAPFRVSSVCFSCPKKFVSFKFKSSSKTLTEEQRKVAAERLKRARETRA